MERTAKDVLIESHLEDALDITGRMFERFRKSLLDGLYWDDKRDCLCRFISADVDVSGLMMLGIVGVENGAAYKRD